MIKNSLQYFPTFLKSALENNKSLKMTFGDIKDRNVLNTSSSFFYDPAQSPLKNTQQLNVDWSKFENHTFFSSAEVKVNSAFEQIINGYPFDGTRIEIERFFENLTGFERYVFDSFPRFKGQLLFSGTQVGEDTDGTSGVWISVKDAAGSLYPEISKNKNGQSIINPKNRVSFTIEAQIKPAQISNDTQVIFQKISGSNFGISFHLLPTASSQLVTASFCVSSGSAFIETSAFLKKGLFNHVCVTLNREERGVDFLDFYVDETLVNRSQRSHVIGELDIGDSNINIGTGSTFIVDGTPITPTQTFSGSLDELRVFHSVRTQKQQQLFSKKAVYASDDLKLYYRFNEPPVQLGSSKNDVVNSIVLDSSGNSLHSTINNYFSFIDVDVNNQITGCVLRENAENDVTSNMIYEKDETCAVLFPSHPNVISLNTKLLTSASAYDLENPNIITKLIPKHYLLEGAAEDGFENIEGNINSSYGGSGIPGQGSLGSTQIILTFLYMWAKFFDEMKLYVDAFSTLKFVDYNKLDTAPDNSLDDFVRDYGFNLPPLFNNTTLEQYIDAENIGSELATSAFPLKQVQNEILRRVLVNLPNILKSKGTQHSIKSFLRAVGIDPNNTIKLREHGGPTQKQLTFSREKRLEPSTMVQFETSSYVFSPFLSASRVEIGWPEPKGVFVKSDVFPPYGISNFASDGLLTSGSWTVEATYRYTTAIADALSSQTQSLCRLMTTGSNGEGLVVNLLAITSSVSVDENRLVLYARPTNSTVPSAHLKLELPLSERNIFDAERWNVSFGRIRNDALDSVVSSSYFLRAAVQNNGEIAFFETTSSWHDDVAGFVGTVYDTISSTCNASGCFLALGSNQIINSGVGVTKQFLNNSSAAPDEARITSFDGRVSSLRFWSRALEENEWKEHVRNFKSVGVNDPLVNYNYEKTREGSFERLRLMTLDKQEVRRAISTASLGETGSIKFIDFSENGFHLTGSGFPQDKDCYIFELFDSSYISPYFDEAASDEKIRIRSFIDESLVNSTPWATLAPRHELNRSDVPTDDTRLSIEFSLIEALNRDIITLFATLDSIDNAIGSPELVFSPDYPDLEKLRNIYFNRVKEKVNFKEFFEFFSWFDSTLGTFIQQLIPRKTTFNGTNFVVESHMLERHKLEQQTSEIYLGEANRSKIRNAILLQMIDGSPNKY